MLKSKTAPGEAFSVEQNRRRYILLFVSYITSAIMLVLGFKHFLSNDYLLQLILFCCSAAFLCNAAWFHASNQLEKACLIEAVLVAGFVLGLVAHGGYAQTALFWVFPFPPIIFGLLGAKRGIQINLLLLIALALLLYGPHWLQAEYREAEKSRFIASMLTLILACLINEHFRERSHNSMDLIQRSKENQANTDALTELANRRFIDQVLPAHLTGQPELFFPLALIMADLDHFKYVNDSFGHAQGDRVLQQLAVILRSKLRNQDIASRMGGEEFLLLLPHTQLADAQKVAGKIRQVIAQKRFLAEYPDLVITCSFGVSVINSAEEFIAGVAQADSQLYQAKTNGRNQVC